MIEHSNFQTCRDNSSQPQPQTFSSSDLPTQEAKSKVQTTYYFSNRTEENPLCRNSSAGGFYPRQMGNGGTTAACYLKNLTNGSKSPTSNYYYKSNFPNQTQMNQTTTAFNTNISRSRQSSRRSLGCTHIIYKT